MTDDATGRRGALGGVLRALREAGQEITPPPPYPRPPGAVNEHDFLLLCTRCGDCGPACPHGAIGFYPPNSGRLAGTPAMDPNRAPCHMCDGLPCAAACPESALMAIEEGPAGVFLGLARIQEQSCFVFKGPECGACAPACPIDALTLVAGRPTISAETCTGCGLCRDACPVWDKAIVVDW